MRIDLYDLQFNTMAPDADGASWYITDLEGWDTPNFRYSSQGPSSRHGVVILEHMMSERVLLLRGVVKAPAEPQFWTAYNKLLGQVNNLLEPRTLKVYETTPKECYVVRGGPPRLRFSGVGSFTFEVALTAMDPLKYTSTAKTGTLTNNILLNNAGTFSTYPVITTTSVGTVFLDNLADPNYDAFSTGSNDLPSGTVIDFQKRTVVNGTSNYFQSLAPSSVFWALLPGSNQIQSTGTAGLSYSFRDAWI